MTEYSNGGTDGASTRRTYLRYAAAIGGGTLLAGCTGGGGTSGSADEGGSESDAGAESGSDASSDSSANSESDSDSTSSDSEAISVTMEPVGTVTFDSVPERWETYFPGYADMGIALGQADGLTAIGNPGRFHTGHLEELPGVSIDTSNVTGLLSKSGIDKELYLELDNDVHLTDPKWLTSNDAFGLGEDDVEQLASTVGPFVGNAIFRRTDTWHDYPYYTMYEAFEKVATIFDQQERFEAFSTLHDEFISDLKSALPPAEQRPGAVLAFAASDEPEAFAPYRLIDKGTNKKHLRDLGVKDALAETDVEGLSESNRSKIDYETLLEVDPDLLLVRGHEDKSADEFETTVLGFMQEHSVASDLTAVQNGDVYRGGPIYQGPIHNLFLTERLGTAIYPDTISGELFDRQRVADIITDGA